MILRVNILRSADENRSIRGIGLVIATFFALGIAPVTRASIVSWVASSGFPQTSSMPWLYYREPMESATIQGDMLRLATDLPGARATYFQEYDVLSVPDNLVIEATMRFVSGNTTTPTVAGTGAGIYFYTEKGVANRLWIDKDSIFVNAGSRFFRGPALALDTDSAFHTYRIEFRGKEEGSRFDVFYDEIYALSGTLYSDDEDQEPEIAWGDITYEASGISEWKSFSHNAGVSEPRLDAGCFWVCRHFYPFDIA
jgi:hypothetical protein